MTRFLTYFFILEIRSQFIIYFDTVIFRTLLFSTLPTMSSLIGLSFILNYWKTIETIQRLHALMIQ